MLHNSRRKGQSYGEKKAQELDKMLFFLVPIHVTKMGKMRELGTKPSKTKLNKTKHINKLGVTWTFLQYYTCSYK